MTEATWLVSDPPQRAIDFWKAEGGVIVSMDENREALQRAGFEPVGDFVLPSEVWEEYYGPMQLELQRFVEEQPGDMIVEEFARSMQREVDMWYDCGDSYGYVFYLGKKPSENG